MAAGEGTELFVSMQYNIAIASCSIVGNVCPGQMSFHGILCYLPSSRRKGLYDFVTILEINRVPWVVI